MDPIRESLILKSLLLSIYFFKILNLFLLFNFFAEVFSKFFGVSAFNLTFIKQGSFFYQPILLI